MTTADLQPRPDRGTIAANILTATSIIAGIVFRWAQLGKKSLWFDEGYTAWVVSYPLQQVVRLIRADTAPPGYYILLRGWVQLFGSSESALRSMSALASSLALLLFWRVAKKVLVRPWAVAVSTGVFCFGYMQVGYAHECRFYALMSLVGLIDFYLVLRACESSSIFRLFVIAGWWAVSLYLNNVMAIYLACLGIGWLILPGPRRIKHRLVDASIVTVLAAAAFSPWLPSLVAQSKALQGNFWPDRPTGWVFMRTITAFAGVDERSFDRVNLPGFWRIGGLLDAMQKQCTYAYVLLPIVAIGIVLAITRTGKWRLPTGLFVVGIGPIVIVYFYSLVRQPIFMDRAFMGCSFAVPLLVGLPWIFRSATDSSDQTGSSDPTDSHVGLPVIAACLRRVWMILLAILIAPSLWSQRLSEHDEDWRTLSAVSKPRPGVRQLTVFVANEGEIIYDYYSRGGDYSATPDQTGAPVDYFAADPPHTMVRVRTDADLAPLCHRLAVGDFDQVVLVASHRWFADHDDRTFLLLKSTYGDPAEQWVPPGILSMYRFRATR